jgi:hypothetical protein
LGDPVRCTRAARVPHPSRCVHCPKQQRTTRAVQPRIAWVRPPKSARVITGPRCANRPPLPSPRPPHRSPHPNPSSRVQAARLASSLDNSHALGRATTRPSARTPTSAVLVVTQTAAHSLGQLPMSRAGSDLVSAEASELQWSVLRGVRVRGKAKHIKGFGTVRPNGGLGQARVRARE